MVYNIELYEHNGDNSALHQHNGVQQCTVSAQWYTTVHCISTLVYNSALYQHNDALYLYNSALCQHNGALYL